MKKRLVSITLAILMAFTSGTTAFAEEIPGDAAVITSAPTTEPAYVLAGNCTTSLKGSSASRINNITVGAARMNGLVVAPGQAVSVSAVILPRTAENGYQEAGAYLNGKVIQATGGGVCQISSTTYNAVMNAGLLVLQRYPHSMPVHYLPLGQDAAISAGSKDLIFMNPYDTPILIQTIVADKLFTVNVFVEAVSLQGRSFKLRAESTGALSAKTYLDCYQNGILVGTMYVGASKYSAPKE